jgi:hypothetical protein
VRSTRKTFESSDDAKRISQEEGINQIMKPTMQSIDKDERELMSNPRFPVTDFNYQSVALKGHSGHCAKTDGPSFHSISRDYFKGEAHQYSLAEAFVFGVIMAMSALPILNGAHAVADMVRTLGGV